MVECVCATLRAAPSMHGRTVLSELCLQLVSALSELKLAARLEAARQAFAAHFPLPEDQWTAWLQDAMANMRDEADAERLLQLARRSLDDYLSVELWQQYLMCAATTCQLGFTQPCRPARPDPVRRHSCTSGSGAPLALWLSHALKCSAPGVSYLRAHAALRERRTRMSHKVARPALRRSGALRARRWRRAGCTSNWALLCMPRLANSRESGWQRQWSSTAPTARRQGRPQGTLRWRGGRALERCSLMAPSQWQSSRRGGTRFRGRCMRHARRPSLTRWGAQATCIATIVMAHGSKSGASNTAHSLC